MVRMDGSCTWWRRQDQSVLTWVRWWSINLSVRNDAINSAQSGRSIDATMNCDQTPIPESPILCLQALASAVAQAVSDHGANATAAASALATAVGAPTTSPVSFRVPQPALG